MQIRNAVPSDASTLLKLIQALADYEREPQAVRVTAANLAEQLSSEQPPFEAVIAVEAEEPLGFALFFHNYSTWRGKRGLYLEDLFVLPERRGKGVGRALLQHLAQLALARNCARFEWAVLDWNQPAIDFYEGLGATALREWTVYRLTDDALERLAAGKEPTPHEKR